MDEHFVKVFSKYSHRHWGGLIQLGEEFLVGVGWKFWARRIGWIAVHGLVAGAAVGFGYGLGQWFFGSPW